MQTSIIDIESILDLSQTIASSIFENIKYPWEVLPLIKDFIVKLGKSLPSDEFDEIKENVWISKTARISAFASINAPAIIDDGADIRHCAFIRGNAIIGKNVVVGNSSEIKNAILFNNVQVPHFNYVGDSILGYRSHLGAGAIISNVKSDKSNVSVKINGEKLSTNLRKFGAIVGDFVEIGCNAVLNPGTIIKRNSNIYPLTMVRGTIEENVIVKNTGQIVAKI